MGAYVDIRGLPSYRKERSLVKFENTHRTKGRYFVGDRKYV